MLLEPAIPMRNAPYSQLPRLELTLRDQLAIDRTALANERTLLAYGRTGLALSLVGGSLIKFFDSLAIMLIGWLFVIAGLLTMTAGTVRFVRMRRELNAIVSPPERGTGHAEAPGADATHS